MSQMDVCEWRRRVEGVLGTCGISANTEKNNVGFPSISVIYYVLHIGFQKKRIKRRSWKVQRNSMIVMRNIYLYIHYMYLS